MLKGRQNDVHIERGYYFDDYDSSGNDDSGIIVIYDAVDQRAYVRATTF
jgi:hypothetical protein